MTPPASAAAGKVVLITGGASGIGRATAALFAAEGAAAVVIVDRAELSGPEADELLGSIGGTARHIAADVTSEAAIEAAVAATLEEFGRLDAAVNCAGVAGNGMKIADTSLADWNQVLGVNLTGVFLSLKHEIRAMLPAGAGTIVNIASAAGLVPVPYLSPYCSSKHGVLGLTKTAAREYRNSGLRINAICPGVVDTPMVRAGAEARPEVNMRSRQNTGGFVGQPEQIASAALWLCSDGASFVNGESMVVDGGTITR